MLLHGIIWCKVLPVSALYGIAQYCDHIVPPSTGEDKNTEKYCPSGGYNTVSMFDCVYYTGQQAFVAHGYIAKKVIFANQCC